MGTQNVTLAIPKDNLDKLKFFTTQSVNNASQPRCAVLWTDDISEGRVCESAVVQNPFSETG